MIKKYKARVKHTLYRDEDGFLGPKYDMDYPEELVFKRNTTGYIYLIEDNEKKERIYDGIPQMAVFIGKNNKKEMWFESLEDAKKCDFLEITDLTGGKEN